MTQVQFLLTQLLSADNNILEMSRLLGLLLAVVCKSFAKNSFNRCVHLHVCHIASASSGTVSPAAKHNVPPTTLTAQAIFFLPVKGFSNYIYSAFFYNDARTEGHSFSYSIYAGVHHCIKHPSTLEKPNSITNLADKNKQCGSSTQQLTL